MYILFQVLFKMNKEQTRIQNEKKIEQILKEAKEDGTNLKGDGREKKEEKETNPNQCTYVNTFPNLVRNEQKMEQTLKRKRWKKEKRRTMIIIKNRHE